MFYVSAPMILLVFCLCSMEDKPTGVQGGSVKECKKSNENRISLLKADRLEVPDCNKQLGMRKKTQDS